MNVTPMIDVVFLLIIFFMVITDMSQKDLEDLSLPVAMSATPDRPTDRPRPVLNISLDGTVRVRGKVVYSPEWPAHRGGMRDLEAFLADQAARMETVVENGVELPADPILVRADQNAPFKIVQEIMESCAKKGISIRYVELAVSEPEVLR